MPEPAFAKVRVSQFGVSNDGLVWECGHIVNVGSLRRGFEMDGYVV